jgi:hypothetical protein
MHERELLRRAGPSARRRSTVDGVDPRVARLLALQRSAGNQAVARMFFPPEAETDEQGEQSWSFGSWFDPRHYLPTRLGGYTDRQARATQNPDPPFGRDDFPKAAAEAFRLAFLIVEEDRKQRPDDVTLEEYNRTAGLLGQIWSGATGMGIATNLDPGVQGGDEARNLKLKTETLKDIIEIARTVMGRRLLTDVAQAAKEVRVTIETNEYVDNPTAGERDRGIPLTQPQRSVVKYTPTAYKTGLAGNYAPNLSKQQALKSHNPWLTPHRADISLLHELIHAFHFQRATTKPKDELVGAGVAVDAVDAPFAGQSFGEATQEGVREEEYATVGLGPYRDDPYTENRYRGERRDMGEDVPDRDYYTVKDAHGQRVREHVGV